MTPDIKKLQGSIVAIVTPMLENGQIDYPAFYKLLDIHLANNTQGIVVAGTTGESASLTTDEHIHIIHKACEHVGSNICIIAGTGSNSTRESIELNASIANSGAAAVLSVVPYYNKPNQEGLFRHFSAIADSSSLPVILYDVPSRCVVSLAVETIAKLAKHPNIIGIKDATGDMSKASSTRATCAEDFLLYSGDDKTSVSFMQACNGNGVISVIANLLPLEMQAIMQACVESNYQQAQSNFAALADMDALMCCDANPIPVKYAVHKRFGVPNGIRLPLVPLAENLQDAINHALEQFPYSP